MPIKNYAGTPEKYLVVNQTETLDTDALLCALNRAQAVCALLLNNFKPHNDRLGDGDLFNACWALEGLLDQAEILLRGKNPPTDS